MTVRIEAVQQAELISALSYQPLSDSDRAQFHKCFLNSTELWVGYKDNQLVCCWGLIPPYLLADQAYLWLYTTPALSGNEFPFVRHSQKAVAKMLEKYPTIVGHAAVDTPRSRAWLRWLGASFEDGPLVPFIIRKKANG